MGIGVSLFLLAVGAILAFAVEVDTEGVNMDTIGLILMAVGGLGFLFSLLWTTEVLGRGRETHVVREDRL